MSKWAEKNWKLHLEPYFGHRRASSIGTDQLSSYIANRKSEKAANGTINRELAMLRRAFTLGYKARPRKVTALLDLSEHMLEENNVRTGFVTQEQYKALAEKAAGEALAAYIACPRVHVWVSEGRIARHAMWAGGPARKKHPAQPRRNKKR